MKINRRNNTLLGAALFIFLGFGLLLLLRSYQTFADELPKDTKLQQVIEGSWTRSDEFSQWSLAFDANGVYREHDINVRSNVQRTFTYEGKWQIQAGMLITTITKTSVPELEPVGSTHLYKIIRLDATDLVYRSENGQTAPLKRKGK
jgi:hypothetical protein